MRKLAGTVIGIGLGIMVLMLSMTGRGGTFSLGTEAVDIRKPIVAEGFSSISVKGSSTDIEIMRGSGENIEVALEGRASAKYLDDLDIIVSKSSNTLQIEPVIPEFIRSFGINILSVDLVVTLPDQVLDLIKVEAGSGNIRAVHTQASEILLETRSGNVTFAQVEAAEIQVYTGAGNVTGEHFQADRVSFDTGSGNVKLMDGSGKLNGEVGSGNITVAYDTLEQDTDLKAGSGNVNIQTRKPESLAFDFSADSGEIKIGWPYKTITNGEREDSENLTGHFGGGEVALKVSSGSGNIRLVQR